MSPAASSDDDELARLQAAAFSRGATERDVRALAQFVARRNAAAGSDPVGAVPAAAASDPGSEEPPLSGPDGAASHSDPRRRPVALLVAVGVVALGGGIAIGWLAATVTGFSATTGAASSLAIFDDDRGAVEAGDLFSAPLDRQEARLLGVIDDVEIFGIVGSGTSETAGSSGDVVCLEVHWADDSGGASCVERDHFERSGIALGYGSRVVTWGPTGPPAIVPCFPQEWPDACG